MLCPVSPFGHDRQVGQPIIARVAIAVINVLISDGCFAVLLNHQPTRFVTHRPILDLLRSTLVGIVLTSIITGFLCQGSLL